MRYETSLIATEPARDIYFQLNDISVLKQLFGYDTRTNVQIHIQTVSQNTISGIIDHLYVSNYFQIILQPQHDSKTRIDVTISDNPFEFTQQYIQQQEKTKNKNYSIASIAAVALVALLIPTGILAMPYLTDESLIKETELSQSEQHLTTAQLYSTQGQHTKALQLYEEYGQQNPGSIESILGSRLSLAEIQYYDQLLRDYTSLILIDPNYVDPTTGETTLQVLFYPEGVNGPEILVPRTHDFLSISLDSITDNTIPAIVYPQNSEYPAVVYSEDLRTQQIGFASLLNSVIAEDSLVVTPGILTSTDAKFILSRGELPLEYHNGPDGPYVVYPYGISNTEDLPALVFPQREYYPLTITAEKVPEGIIPSDITTSHSESTIPSVLIHSDSGTVAYTDVVFENGVDKSVLESYDQNTPVRVFPDGEDSQPIEYPAGLGFVEVVNFPSLLDDKTFISHLVETNFSGSTSVNYGLSGAPSSPGSTGTGSTGTGTKGESGGSSIEGSSSAGGDIETPIDWNIDPPGKPDSGDPLIFSLDKPAKTTRNWPQWHESRLTQFDLYQTGEKFTLSRTLDDGTLTLFLDLNGDGMLTDGTEWLFDQHETVYQILSREMLDSNQN